MTAAVTPGVESATAPDHAPPFSRAYTRYAMGLLLGIYIVNFLDRQVINILAEPIKRDLGLSDTALGLMSGLAFALFYTVLGIPLARLAERKNRAYIIGGSVAVWSGFTALCATAGNFWQLVLYRIGVGVGEAGCTPPAHSLIVDYVPKEKRSSALAFYSMGTPLGSLLGLVLGGLIADAYGWRMAFLVAGLPGIVFAILAFTTLKEPRRILARHAEQVKAAQATFGETVRYLTAKPTFWLIALGAAIKAFIGYGHAPFTASFFLRVHEGEIAALAAGFGLGPVGFLGLALGIIAGVGGALGAWLGGWIADAVGKTNVGNHMVTPAIASLAGVPVYCAAVLVDSALVALALLTLSYFLGTMWYGPVYGTAQSIVPPHMRATGAAILLFIVNLVGLGLGPLAVGALSDWLNVGQGLGSAEGIRWALIAAACTGVLAFLGFWLARRTLPVDSVS
ncbi:major facilitator superfamily MFS_1 [Phenylobacterium zucineum HLK1]|uniref:Major facilitator superfamily MFS_1 n=1 Tax=Phenylobacterium zucineum (strain HLK1) TaxID=450851 RepID=B4RHH8_PHEZH|nr:MFS transporter [Phenylobacterium zucineum]ACG77438.1 major facilitator superfamily MFS_1 [Phenylobacterium zucineum HLK1]